jgi:hypothetical protein
VEESCFSFVTGACGLFDAPRSLQASGAELTSITAEAAEMLVKYILTNILNKTARNPALNPLTNN